MWSGIIRYKYLNTKPVSIPSKFSAVLKNLHNQTLFLWSFPLVKTPTNIWPLFAPGMDSVSIPSRVNWLFSRQGCYRSRLPSTVREYENTSLFCQSRCWHCTFSCATYCFCYIFFYILYLLFFYTLDTVCNSKFFSLNRVKCNTGKTARWECFSVPGVFVTLKMTHWGENQKKQTPRLAMGKESISSKWPPCIHREFHRLLIWGLMSESLVFTNLLVKTHSDVSL